MNTKPTTPQDLDLRPEPEVFRQVATDDPRFNWNMGSWTPQGRVQFKPTATAKNWMYVSYGETAEQAADNENHHTLAKIAEAEAKIAEWRATLVKP